MTPRVRVLVLLQTEQSRGSKGSALERCHLSSEPSAHPALSWHCSSKLERTLFLRLWGLVSHPLSVALPVLFCILLHFTPPQLKMKYHDRGQRPVVTSKLI